MADDTLALVRECRRQGLRVEERTNGWFIYSRYRHGGAVMVHRTPSDQRGLLNTISRLKKIGFRDSEALRSIEAQTRDVLRAEMRTDAERALERAEQLVLAHQPEVREEVETVMADAKRRSITCEHCDRTFTWAPAFGQHMKNKHPEHWVPSAGAKGTPSKPRTSAPQVKAPAPALAENGLAASVFKDGEVNTVELRKQLDTHLSEIITSVVNPLVQENKELKRQLKKYTAWFEKGLELVP